MPFVYFTKSSNDTGLAEIFILFRAQNFDHLHDNHENHIFYRKFRQATPPRPRPRAWGGGAGDLDKNPWLKK